MHFVFDSDSDYSEGEIIPTNSNGYIFQLIIKRTNYW